MESPGINSWSGWCAKRCVARWEVDGGGVEVVGNLDEGPLVIGTAANQDWGWVRRGAQKRGLVPKTTTAFQAGSANSKRMCRRDEVVESKLSVFKNKVARASGKPTRPLSPPIPV